MVDIQFLLRILVASFATVGVLEYLKNFFVPKKKQCYAIIMLPFAVVCYIAIELLPLWVIGGILTVGCVQLCYQTLVQGFTSIVANATNKVSNKEFEKNQFERKRSRHYDE